MSEGSEMSFSALQEKVSLACRILAMEGHEDITQGHVSARDPDRPECFWIKRAGIALSEVRPEDVVCVTLEGHILHGEGKLHTELPIHTEIYRAHAEIKAVVHTHPLHAVALSATRKPLLPLSHEGALLGEVPLFEDTTGLIHLPDQGARLAALLEGGKKALLLKNHGIVTVGRSVEEATLLAIALDRAARIQIFASCLGEVSGTPESEKEAKSLQLGSDWQIQRNWLYYVRKLDKILSKDRNLWQSR